MTYIPNNYTSEDITAIEQAYAQEDGSIDYDAINSAIENRDESHAQIEDLISYYLANLQEMPAALSDLSDPEAYSDLWALDSDGELSDSLNVWKMNFSYLNDTTADSSLKDYYAALISDLEGFLETGSSDTSLVNEIATFIDNSKEIFEETYEESENDGMILLTDAMDWALRVIGSPGLAILFYITGSRMKEYDDDGNVVEVHENTGFGEVVNDFQDEVVNKIEEANEELDSLVAELADLNYDDTESAQAIAEEIRRRMNVIDSVVNVETNLLQMSQDLLDSLQEAAANLNRTQFMTARSMTN